MSPISLAVPVAQVLLMAALALVPFRPSDGVRGPVLVLPRGGADALAARTGAHWDGLAGPFGLVTMTGDVARLRAAGALVVLDLRRVAALCGGRA